MHDRVDEWVTAHLTEFDGKALQSVAKGRLELGRLEDEAEKKKEEEQAGEYKDLIEKVKQTLGERVKDVRATLRLTYTVNQVNIATTVTTPVLITVLAIIGGVIIVGAGGGIIKPMQSRWEAWLNKADAEAQRIKQEAGSSPSAGEQLRQKADELRGGATAGTSTGSTATGSTASSAAPTQKLPPAGGATSTSRPTGRP